jgi:hypothetical protein
MRTGSHQLSQSEFSPSISSRKSESDKEIVYDTSPFFAAFYDHSVDDSDESPDEWSDDEPYVAMGIINSYLEAEPVRTRDPRPTPYQKAKVKALEHWDARLGAVTMVTDSDESIAKSPDYIVQPVVSLPKTGSFLMEVDESSGPETISVLAPVSEEEQAIQSTPSSSLVVGKDDDEISMGDEYEYDGAEDTKVGSYAQVSPYFSLLRSTNEVEQCYDVQGDIRLGSCPDRSQGHPGQIYTNLHLRYRVLDSISSFVNSNKSGNKYAMESRAKCSLLDNTVPTCDSELLCHSGCPGCQTRKEYKDFPTR